MANRAGRLYEQQASADQQLQSALRADAARRGAAAGLTPSEQTRLAGDKRELASQLQQLDQQLGDAARQYRADAPQAAQALTQAGHDLHEADLPNQLERAAQYIENGRAAYIAAAESGVTDGLRGLRDQLRQAAALAGARSAPERDAVGDELARVQALREQLQRLNAQAQAGQREPPQQAQRSAQGQGQSGAQSTGAAAPGSDSSGYAAAGGGPRGGLGGGELNDVVRGLHDINGTLRNRGVSAKDISAMNELARELAAAGITPRGDVIGRNLSDQVSLLEQLEAQLAASARPDSRGRGRARERRLQGSGRRILPPAQPRVAAWPSSMAGLAPRD
jgi:hypothetical protein